MLVFKVGEQIELKLKKQPLSKKAAEPYVVSVNRYGKPKTNPAITVQITAYNEGDGLLKCLDSVKSQTFKDYEIILVDNGLDEDTKQTLKKYDLLHIITSDNLGCTHGRNVGSVYSTAELVAFIDADGILEKHHLERAVKTMKDETIVAVRGKVLPFENTSSVPGHYDIGNKSVPAAIETEGNSVWRRADYIKVGGFENSLAGGEGAVICYRMVSLYGYDYDSFKYEPGLILYHDFHSDKAHLQNKLYKQAIIRDALAKRYPLMNDYLKYYRDKGERRKNTDDAAIASMTDQQRSRVNREYEQVYEQNLKQRLLKPESVKGQSKYDFSVIIPCFNLGSLIDKAVDSVLKQSIASVQIIVVDDVSTDPKTHEVLKQLESKVEVLYLKENRGVANARNKGIEKAKSDYVLCLDADDTIQPTYLEKAFNIFEMDSKVGIVTSWAKYFGAVDSEWRVKEPVTLKDSLVHSPIPTASCFRKQAWEDAGGYDSEMRGYEDWDFWISILENSWQVKVITEHNFNYFVRPDGKVKTSNKNVHILVGKIYENHKQAYQDNLEYVLVEKHRQILNLRTQIQDLKNYKFRVALGNSPVGPILRAVKKIYLQLIEVVKFASETKNPLMTVRLVRHKFQVGFYKIKRLVS